MVSAKLTAVVVTHDSEEVLPSCLAALAAEDVAAIVVDNASRDRTPEIARAAGVILISNAGNEGYGRAMNIGMRAASGRYCLLLNPDLVLGTGTVVELLAAAEHYPDAGLLAPRLVEPDGRLFFQARSLLSPYLRNETGRPCLPQGDCCAPFLSGACLLADRELVLSLGGFDEEIFLFYEDDDLCRRVIDAGHSLVHVDAALARHVRGGSSATVPGSVYDRRWHLAWSAGYVAKKHARPDPSWRTFAVNGLKFCAASLARDPALKERYRGSAAGAFAWLTGRTALARQGLATPPR